jgi:hypothetical protein
VGEIERHETQKIYGYIHRMKASCSPAVAIASLILAMISCQHGPVQNTSPTAVEEFADLRKAAQAADKAGDNPQGLRAAIKMQRLLHDAPDAVEFTALAYWANRDTQNTVRMLRLFADLGQTDTGLLKGNVKRFAELRKLPQYQAILERFVVNQTAVCLAEPAFTLNDQNVLPEDIDYGFASVAKEDWGRSAVLCYDLHSGVLRQRIETPPNKSLGDMALTQEGDPIVCDGDGGGVYRVVNNDLQLINDADFISPQTPVMLPDQQHILIPDYVRGVGILNLRTKLVTWLNEDGVVKVALNGVDGLYFDRGALILTQNGTSPECVKQLQLDKSLTQVKSAQIIERGTATLGDPTHGVIVNGFFYYIANSGWNEIDEHGNLKAGDRLTPAKIMRFKLG